MKERFTKTGILVTLGAVFLIAVCGWVFLKGKTAKQMTHVQTQQKQAEVKHMTVSDFPVLTSTSTQEVQRALLKAFSQGSLREIEKDDIPGGKGDVLVLAAPFMEGNASGTTECGLQENPLCGLYVRPAKGDARLLLWGSRLTGYTGIESFPDANHAIVGMMWNLYDFTSIDRSQLDLQNGDLVPKLSIEQDVGDTGVDIRVSGYGDIVTLSIVGKRSLGMIFPTSVLVKNQSGAVIQKLNSQDVQRFQASMQEALTKKNYLESVLLLPTADDVQTLTLHMALYGEPYVLDLKAKKLVSAK